MKRTCSSTHKTHEIVQYLKTKFPLAYELFWSILLKLGGSIVLVINYLLDTAGAWFIENYHLKGQWPHIGGDHSQDFVSPPAKDVDVRMLEAQYGPDANETVDVLRHQSGESDEILVYLHGGGWLAANSAVLLHSVVPFVRNGYTVYSANYPLAPKHRFPGPLVSILRLLHWLRTERKIKSVQMLGDSAGGNLVTIAAALIENPQLYCEFTESVLPLGIDMRDWNFPTIKAVASAYGIMCQGEGWSNQLDTIGPIENSIGHFIYAFGMRMYRSRDNIFDNRFTLIDLYMRSPKSFCKMPPTFLFCGDKDHLSLSNQLAFESLRDMGADVRYTVYPGRHAFFGLPPSWIGKDAVRESSLPALIACLDFFKSAQKVNDLRNTVNLERIPLPY
ncbi:hypothetical protein SARC_05622 [Sphaeroforma arctica JP610]|uniref:Alpha/beta hydrolase fold-3 domain-containing protein n=1 Tax=Sphaeroforma arctica JP610 TaxID=667725 RepID=A0A0L0G1P5_9EUKA|nr:hypothetical protein SARC_05622 [Sphaeroforma arctica JP610]KNC82093.1 hypothetical protein SARC_05622 [Sphaeroforma arctica JP610]|eukprot:XP_014155995.1 hypothetical protein SARC_05622 [Sphaeroforma arctica JP610]